MIELLSYADFSYKVLNIKIMTCRQACDLELLSWHIILRASNLRHVMSKFEIFKILNEIIEMWQHREAEISILTSVNLSCTFTD